MRLFTRPVCSTRHAFHLHAAGAPGRHIHVPRPHYRGIPWPQASGTVISCGHLRPPTHEPRRCHAPSIAVRQLSGRVRVTRELASKGCAAGCGSKCWNLPGCEGLSRMVSATSFASEDIDAGSLHASCRPATRPRRCLLTAFQRAQARSRPIKEKEGRRGPRERVTVDLRGLAPGL